MNYEETPPCNSPPATMTRLLINVSYILHFTTRGSQQVRIFDEPSVDLASCDEIRRCAIPHVTYLAKRGVRDSSPDVETQPSNTPWNTITSGDVRVKTSCVQTMRRCQSKCVYTYICTNTNQYVMAKASHFPKISKMNGESDTSQN